MVSSTFKFIILSALTLSAVANPVPAPVSPCAAIHIIVARASGEDQGPGIIGALAEQVQRQSRQTVSSSNVVYPATLTDYADSSSAGTAAAKIMLTEQVNRCPNQKIVMMGYSQVCYSLLLLYMILRKFCYRVLTSSETYLLEVVVPSSVPALIPSQPASQIKVCLHVLSVLVTKI